MTDDKPTRATPESIYRELRDRICLLDLPPGAPLREQSLAEEFGVSRTPVREALTRLRYEGLVTSQPGGGASVTTVDLKSMREVWSLRLKLAEVVADFLRMTPADSVLEALAQLEGEVRTIAPSRDTRRLGAIYNRFHEVMLEVIANPHLRRIVDQLYRQTARVWVQVLPEMDWDQEVEIVLDELAATREALEAGSSHRLAEVRAKHMQMLLSRFNDYLSRPLI